MSVIILPWLLAGNKQCDEELLGGQIEYSTVGLHGTPALLSPEDTALITNFLSVQLACQTST